MNISRSVNNLIIGGSNGQGQAMKVVPTDQFSRGYLRCIGIYMMMETTREASQLLHPPSMCSLPPLRCAQAVFSRCIFSASLS